MEQKDNPNSNIDDTPIGELPTVRIASPAVRRFVYGRSLDRAIIAAASVGCLYLAYFIASMLYPDVRELYGDRIRLLAIRYWPNAGAVIVLLVVGFNLYVLYGYRRAWFGIAEIAFACGLGWYAVNKAFTGEVPDAIVIFLAALYMVGRGFIDIASRFAPLRIEQK